MGSVNVEVDSPSPVHLRAGNRRGGFSSEARRREADPLFELLDRGVTRIELSLQAGRTDIRGLLHRYRSLLMSLADACLVRLSELHANAEVFTLDSDFRIYRRHGNKVIRILRPD